MAIAKMNRFTLLTFHTHRQALLKQLQVFGDVHFKTPGPEELESCDFLRPDFSQEQLGACEAELEKVRFAAGRLAPFADKPGLTARRPRLTFGEFDGYTAEYDYDSVYREVKERDEEISALASEIGRRQAENEQLAAWRSLDAAPGALDALKQAGYLLGTVNRLTAGEFGAALEENFDCACVELLDTVKDDTSLLLLFPADREEEIFAFAREQGFTRAALSLRGIPAEVIEENSREIDRLREKQEAARDAIRARAPEHAKLQIAQDCFETVLERERARRSFLTSDTTLLIEGWVPADSGKALREILENVCGGEYFLEEEAVEHDSETVPIKLKNNRFVGAFESITAMYSMPRYNEVDPTPILAPFYWLFFGMMVGDVGYGAVVLIATTLALKFLDLKEGMRGFMRFFRFLSIAVILMGFVYGGAFGVTIFAPIPVYNDAGALVGQKAILDSQADITTMLVISIAIGVLHIVTGLLTKAYVGFRDGNIADGLFDGVFWIVALLSGIGWLLGGTGIAGGPLFGAVCKWVFIASLVGLAATQGRSSPSIGGKIGNGLYGVYGISGYVGDVVSYTRIVALALSGAYIAYAFNLMGNLIPGVLRWVFGAVIVVFGQTLNLGLALLGGYVHSCRLQYVEFFGKFYEGGGVFFRPLTLKTEHIHITK